METKERFWSARGMVLDRFDRKVKVGSQEVSLSNVEFRLFQALMGACPETRTRSELLAEAWGITHDPKTNVVDVYINYLRRKLGDAAIETVRGSGYRLALPRGVSFADGKGK